MNRQAAHMTLGYNLKVLKRLLWKILYKSPAANKERIAMLTQVKKPSNHLNCNLNRAGQVDILNLQFFQHTHYWEMDIQKKSCHFLMIHSSFIQILAYKTTIALILLLL